MFISKRNCRAALANLYKEGAVVTGKDFEIKHGEMSVSNPEVIKVIQSSILTGYFKTQCSWKWYYHLSSQNL
ncbi:hypothetical protein WALSEDRAFT_20332 [Wallemia mellicola CBS 633.66]|uniref:Plectin/eS10 N-terminal domain-containing protein n=1 Tax=Wallemia mellicola (strain ATCC MYA-4683 / CBS 633.66) TaxID=671144 RepID=I4Y9H4_WALMC|nr:hypothetical protein WALSEDRAFT_20332 [Wallemia mellicola CBS 633.66]EIM20616.1 hypothetical protein WALSEDRAFT_20332 [Wallemia mellicola CBS 633.66]|eukprot:XP_006959317.1 hypothetical protein WALSEDRAFT_20332 [Wallemia mellicola CBS 633.66]